MSFVERVGGVLVAPRAAMRAALAAPPGRGAADVALLIALRVVAGETPRLVRAWDALVEHGGRAALMRLVVAVSQVLPDVLGILIGAVTISLGAGRRKSGDRGLDLAAYAWVPYLAVQLVFALAFSALRYAPPAWVQTAVAGVALTWSVAVWAIGLACARSAS
jgi:hypothetical protein